MNFFDSLIDNVMKQLNVSDSTSYPYNAFVCRNDMGYSQVIMQRDTAFELSGTGMTLVTSDDINDEIIVIGDDLDNIRDNRKFARISIVQTDDIPDEQNAYKLIRKIEYVKYHYFPDGYMIRTSSTSHKEAVRVAKSAIKEGITFNQIGNLLIKKYKEIDEVRGVKVIFVTVPDADYDSFSGIAQKADSITKTLNHIMNTVNFDCDTCSLKPICDEVEGMRELHFRSKERTM